MTQSTKRAAIYLRQSLDVKEGIASQRNKCVKLAEIRGWNVTATFEDNETRASRPRGPETGWGQMLSRISDFDVVIAVDLDRLLRNTRDLNTLIDLGAQIVTVDGEIDLSTADGEFRATMLAGIARFETRRAQERQRRSKEHRRTHGLWHGGTVPYGYKARNGKLIPSETEKARIHEAARRLLDDRESMHSIVKDWNTVLVAGTGPDGEVIYAKNPDGTPKTKYPTRPTGVDKDGKRKPNIKDRAYHPHGAHWRQPNLRSILMNRSMLGETKAGVVGWEPIIDQRTFDRLQALLTDPARKVTHSPGVKTQRYTMGGGLSVCARCGRPLVTNTKIRHGVKQPALACLGRVNGPSDKHPIEPQQITIRSERVKTTVMREVGRPTIDHKILEDYVFSKVMQRINKTDRFLDRVSETDPKIQAEVDALETERSALRDQRERAGKAYVLGVMTERDSIAAVEEVGKQLKRIEGRINELFRRPVISKVLEYGIDWESWTPGKRRAFLRLMIDRVIVDVYPPKKARRLMKFNVESDEEYAARAGKYFAEVMKARVKIVWHGTA
ncbi:MAG TPA: recombinase family protein [Candidatus Lumbricidophila sp.]|nr:recombinase family protein [Candidatus Lumbricidophila sp.]